MFDNVNWKLLIAFIVMAVIIIGFVGLSVYQIGWSFLIILAAAVGLVWSLSVIFEE